MNNYQLQKFHRLLRDSRHANTLALWEFSHGGAQWHVVIKGAYRSKGYRSSYTRTPQYWLFFYRDAEPCYAKTATTAALHRAAREISQATGLNFQPPALPP